MTTVTLYTPFYPPQSQAAAIRCYWLVQVMKEAGHRVKVLSSVETAESESLMFNPADNKQNFIKRMIFEVLAGIELFFRILKDSNDIIILSTPPFITVCIAHLACRIKRKKYIIDVRDIYPDVYFAQGLIKEHSILGDLVRVFTKQMYQHAHAVLSVTPGLVAKIKLQAPTCKNVELLLNGYDKEIFKPSMEKYPKFTIMFHGNMGKIQNIPTILKVAEDLRHHNDIEFVFIGDGPQSEVIQRCNLKNVRYLGPKTYKEIPELIAKAHVGFSARRDDEIGSDALPVKVFEYFGVGIPVILTPQAGIVTKLILEGVFEFQNDQIKEIAAKILALKDKTSLPEITLDFSRQESSKKILKFIS